MQDFEFNYLSLKFYKFYNLHQIFIKVSPQFQHQGFDGSYNRGQNSLRQMSFAEKEAFPACKLLPSTANAPLPSLQCWLLEEDILVNSSMKSSSAFNITMRDGGDLNSKFPRKYEVCQEFCPQL